MPVRPDQSACGVVVEVSTVTGGVPEGEGGLVASAVDHGVDVGEDRAVGEEDAAGGEEGGDGGLPGDSRGRGGAVLGGC